MKRISQLILPSLVLISFSGIGVAESKSGPCQLKETKSYKKDVFKVQIGKGVKGTCKFYIDDFFGKKIINANVNLENKTKKTMHCEYYVAFFDKKGKMIGCAAHGTFKDGLKAGKSIQLASCLIELPLGKHEQVSSYQVTFYESEQPIGKK